MLTNGDVHACRHSRAPNHDLSCQGERFPRTASLSGTAGLFASFPCFQAQFLPELSGESDSGRGVGATTTNKPEFADEPGWTGHLACPMLVSTGLGGGSRRLEIDRLKLYPLRKSLSALPVIAALFWAAATLAQPAGTGNKVAPETVTPTSSVLPSIEILAQQGALANTCGGAAFNLNTYIHVDTQASSEVKLSAPGFPNLEQFTDETGANIGPFNGNFPAFTILAFGGGLPPNTPIRVIVNTYTGHGLSGNISYTSTIQFDCTTGTVLNLLAAPPGSPADIPTLGDFALVAMMLLVLGGGALGLRRQSKVSAQRRRRNDRFPR